MSMMERTGTRDLTYSGWHRPDIIGQFIGERQADWLTAIDIDLLETCVRGCYEPLALFETQVSFRPPKPAPIVARLAQRAGIPAYSVSYQKDPDVIGGISLFQVQQLLPDARTQQVVTLTPESYAHFLVDLRRTHRQQAHPSTDFS